MNKEVIYRLLINDKNVIVNGNASTGKTLNVMFPLVDEMLNNKESFIVVDSKEEYVAKYMPKLSKRGYNSVIINLKDFNKSNGWNPLEYPYVLYCKEERDASLELVELLSRSIFCYTGEDKFWTNSARDLFIGIVLSLFEDASPSEINLNSVNQAILSANNKYKSSDYLTEYFNQKDKTSLSYIYASSTVCAPKDTKAGILSVCLQQLRRFIASTSLSNLLSLTTYEIEDLVNRPSAIFIINKPDRDITCEITSMYIEQFLHVLNMHNAKYNVIIDNLNFVNDNFKLSTMMSHDEDDKIKFYIGVRNIDEIENKYNVHIRDFANNIDVNEEVITVNISSDTEVFENEYNHVIFIKNDEDYPKLRNKGINIFNLEYAVSENDRLVSDVEPIININTEEIKEEKTDDVFSGKLDELISSIDKKIDEIDKEEAERKNKKETHETIESMLEANLSKSKDETFDFEPFDADKYLRELNKKVKDLEIGKYVPNYTMDKIDALIKEIDDRITELEKEEFDKSEKEKEERMKKSSKKITSDLSKFKVGVL